MANQFYDGIHSRFEKVNSVDLKVNDHNQEYQFPTHGKI